MIAHPSEELIGTLELDRSSIVLVLEPRCPCGRDHGWLYSDSACDAARRRERIVNESAIDTSRAIAERARRESLQGDRRMP